MTKERADAWTRTSRVISDRPEKVYAAFLDPAALVDCLRLGRSQGANAMRRAFRAWVEARKP